MIAKAVNHLTMGFGLFICLFGLALLLTLPIMIMFGAAHLADGMTEQFGQVLSMGSFLLLSLLGLVLTLLIASFVQEALE